MLKMSRRYLGHRAARAFQRFVQPANEVEIGGSLQTDRDSHSAACQEVIVADHADHLPVIVDHRHGGIVLVQK